MALLRSLFTAFSMYSRIPVPRLDWREDNLRYAIGLFPLVGLIIGVLSYGLVCLAEGRLTGFPLAAVYALVSLIISGGIHVDGFLDTSDALSSYGDREKKHEILSDPHIGSFAVIRLLTYYLLLLASYSVLDTRTAWKMVSAGFFLSRILSGSASVWCRSATGKGTLFAFTDQSQKRSVRGILILQLLGCAAFLLYTSPALGALVLAANLCFFLFWRWLIYSSFGGITGDTAGFLSTMSEAVTAAAAAVWTVVF